MSKRKLLEPIDAPLQPAPADRAARAGQHESVGEQPDRLPKQLDQPLGGTRREEFEEALRSGSVVVPDEPTTLPVSLAGVMATMRVGAGQGITP